MESIQNQGASPTDVQSSFEDRFVSGVIQQCQQKNGVGARLRRADNPATEHQSWEFLASYGIDLEQVNQRLPFVTIAAALARAKSSRNGTVGLGRALALCSSDGLAGDQDRARLRRVLACDDLPELCRVLRPLFSLIDSKTSEPIDFARLLKQLRRFPFNTQQVKAQWAQDFYRTPSAPDAIEGGA